MLRSKHLFEDVPSTRGGHRDPETHCRRAPSTADTPLTAAPAGDPGLHRARPSATAATRRRSARSARRSASRHRPRCTATCTRCSVSATCAGTPPSPGPSRSPPTPPAAPPPSGAPPATSPWSGDVAAGTGVLAQEQVEELVPLPADFTGDGELFMLRVRGDSMIDAGILDGDFIVARVAGRGASNGDVVVAGIPGEEATVKTLPHARAQRRARAVQPDDWSPMVFDPARGRGLRQGRHGPAQALSRRRPARAVGAQLACSAALSPSDQVP